MTLVSLKCFPDASDRLADFIRVLCRSQTSDITRCTQKRFLFQESCSTNSEIKTTKKSEFIWDQQLSVSCSNSSEFVHPELNACVRKKVKLVGLRIRFFFILSMAVIYPSYIMHADFTAVFFNWNWSWKPGETDGTQFTDAPVILTFPI